MKVGLLVDIKDDYEASLRHVWEDFKDEAYAFTHTGRRTMLVHRSGAKYEKERNYPCKQGSIASIP
jgi:hypothetical protein